MTPEPATHPGHRFPAEIISHVLWLYRVFGLSLRDVELILAERGVGVTQVLSALARNLTARAAGRVQAT